MRDKQRQARLHDHRLRGDAARPEDRHFTRFHLHRVAEVRPRQVGNAERRRIAQMDRGPVGAGNGRDAHGDEGLGRSQRPHRNDQRSLKWPGRPARAIGAVHGHVAAGLDMSNRNAGLQQGVFEGKRAAEEKCHVIIAPPVVEVSWFVHQLATAINTVARQIGAEVRGRGRQPGDWATRFGHIEHRARFGIPLAEEQEIERQIA